jgi:hypothetical protein
MHVWYAQVARAVPPISHFTGCCCCCCCYCYFHNGVPCCANCSAAAVLTQWHCAVHHDLQPYGRWRCNALGLQVLKHTLQCTVGACGVVREQHQRLSTNIFDQLH